MTPTWSPLWQHGRSRPAPRPRVARAVVRVGEPRDAQAAECILVDRGYTVDRGESRPGDVLLVVDEWTPEHASHVERARALGVPVTVLAELVLQSLPRPVVAVTGTAGKTSTCRALAHLAREAGRTPAISGTARSGNAWPDHSLVDPPAGADLTIAELTSTHLCHMGKVAPDVAIVTCIRPDHVELHGDIAAYITAKQRLVAHLGPRDALVLPCDDPATRTAIGPTGGTRWWFGGSRYAAGRHGAFIDGDALLLRAPDDEVAGATHAVGTRARSLAAAAAGALALGIAARDVARAMGTVPTPPHRMDRRMTPSGIAIIDDTMAATPLKGAAALADAGPGDLVVVIGGDPAPGGVPVHADPAAQEALVSAVREARRRARVLVAFGPAAAAVAAIARPDYVVGDIDEAIDTGLRHATPGGSVLVTPMFPLPPDARERVLARAGVP